MVYQYAVLVARILGPTMGSDGLQRLCGLFCRNELVSMMSMSSLGAKGFSRGAHGFQVSPMNPYICICFSLAMDVDRLR